MPTALGMALYQILSQNSKDLIIPEIRGKVESWTQQIREHEKTPEDVDKLVIELTTRGLQKMKANQEEIPILLWPDSAYQLAGRLYSIGIGSTGAD